MYRRQQDRWILVGGDATTLALITALGFASHQEAEAIGSSRILGTYLPLLAAWMVTALGLGALDPEPAADPRQLSRQDTGTVWRPALAVLVATPIAAVLRSGWLGTPPVPIFVAVMAGVSLVGLGLWRTAHLLVRRGRQA